MNTKSLFLTIALLVYTSATYAILDTGLPAQWHETYSGADGKSFINLTSVQKTKGGRIVYKEMSTYNTLQQVPNLPLYYTMEDTSVAVDCNSKMYGVYAQFYLDKNGNTVAGANVYDKDRMKLESVGPGTLGEKAINIVCDAQQPISKSASSTPPTSDNYTGLNEKGIASRKRNLEQCLGGGTHSASSCQSMYGR